MISRLFRWRKNPAEAIQPGPDPAAPLPEVTPPVPEFIPPGPIDRAQARWSVCEVKWIINELGHELVSMDTFNCSLFALGTLQGLDLINYRRMEQDPSCREIILAISRKPSTCV